MTSKRRVFVPLPRLYSQTVKDTIGIVVLAVLAVGHVLVYLPITPDPLFLNHWVSKAIPLSMLQAMWIGDLVLCLITFVERRVQPYAVAYSAGIAFMWGISFLMSAHLEQGMVWWSGACDYLALAFFITWGFSRQPSIHSRKADITSWETQRSL